MQSKARASIATMAWCSHACACKSSEAPSVAIRGRSESEQKAIRRWTGCSESVAIGDDHVAIGDDHVVIPCQSHDNHTTINMAITWQSRGNDGRPACLLDERPRDHRARRAQTDHLLREAAEGR